MLNLLIRTFIMYVAVIFVIRLMGKRQQGQLQPFEIVIAMIIADLAAMPMQDEKIPLLRGIIPLAVLLFSQVVFSFIEFRSKKFRNLLNGTPLVLIAHGKINHNNLQESLISFGDLIEELHGQGASDISEVDFAILETNGKISIFLKPEFQGTQKADINADISEDKFSYPVIMNGSFLTNYMEFSAITEQNVLTDLKQRNKLLSDVLFGYVDSKGKLKLLMKSEATQQCGI